MLSFEEAIYQAVAYGDIFDYPLTIQEIHRYLPGIATDLPHVAAALQEPGSITLSETDGYYYLPGRSELVPLRKQRARNATRLWSKAVRYGKLISRLPFVRMVAVTGALAMNNVDTKSDIDYLIVTEPDHLWLTRAQVLLLRRFSRLQNVTLCPNYLVSLRNLVFNDQTLYTAHELAQMIPLAGLDIYADIIHSNRWVYDYLPNAASLPTYPPAVNKPISRSLSRPFLESWMRRSLVLRLEQWEMDRKIRRLQQEQSSSSESMFSADICKGHLHQHQYHTVQALATRIRMTENI